MKTLLVILMIIAVSAGVWGFQAQAADPAALSQVTFYVACYDVGKSALVGLNGIEKVTRGFKDGREINTVYYNPSQISLEEMVSALKAADTYQGMAQ